MHENMKIITRKTVVEVEEKVIVKKRYSLVVNASSGAHCTRCSFRNTDYCSGAPCSGGYFVEVTEEDH